MQGSPEIQTAGDFDPIEGLAPEAPNVFSDGAVDRPTELRRARMAGGVWVPESQVHAQLDSRASDFCFDSVQDGGLVLWIPLFGPTPSSARAEGCALLLAAHLRCPLNVGIDNASVVGRATKILAGQRPWAKPWVL
eukprot:1636947-Alexandrium_andersonii.AAC.1